MKKNLHWAFTAVILIYSAIPIPRLTDKALSTLIMSVSSRIPIFSRSLFLASVVFWLVLIILTTASMLEDGIIYDNQSSITDPETNKSNIGRSGDGYIRITVLDITPNTDGNIYNVYELPSLDSLSIFIFGIF